MKREEAMELVTSGFDELSEALAAGKSESLVAYLDVMARFHDYSFRNCLLIAKQRPTATQVAGYRQWPKLGRHVRKGEKGIAILAPLVYKRKDEERSSSDEGDAEKVVRGFKAVHVFDIEQTEGDPLPTIEEVSGDPGEMLDRLEQAVRNAGIELCYAEQLGGAEGVSQGGKITVVASLAPAAKFLVLVHEYAHELLHRGERRQETNKMVRETEADAVGFVVARAIGLDACSHTSDYIQLYNGDTETLAESMHFIQSAAARIIEVLHHDVQVDRKGLVEPAEPEQHCVA